MVSRARLIGDVGELAAANVGEDVGTVDSGALGAVDSDRVRVVEPVDTQLVTDEDLLRAVVEADGQ